MGYHGVRRGYATLDMVTTKNLDEADDLKPPFPRPVFSLRLDTRPDCSTDLFLNPTLEPSILETSRTPTRRFLEETDVMSYSAAISAQA